MSAQRAEELPYRVRMPRCSLCGQSQLEAHREPDSQAYSVRSFLFLIGCQHLEFRQFSIKGLLKNRKIPPGLARVVKLAGAKLAGAGLKLPVGTSQGLLVYVICLGRARL